MPLRIFLWWRCVRSVAAGFREGHFRSLTGLQNSSRDSVHILLDLDDIEGQIPSKLLPAEDHFDDGVQIRAAGRGAEQGGRKSRLGSAEPEPLLGRYSAGPDPAPCGRR